MCSFLSFDSTPMFVWSIQVTLSHAFSPLWHSIVSKPLHLIYPSCCQWPFELGAIKNNAAENILEPGSVQMCMNGIAGGKIYILKQLKKYHQPCLEVPEAARGFPPWSSTATVQALSVLLLFFFHFLIEVDNLSCTFYVLISLSPTLCLEVPAEAFCPYFSLHLSFPFSFFFDS